MSNNCEKRLAQIVRHQFDSHLVAVGNVRPEQTVDKADHMLRREFNHADLLLVTPRSLGGKPGDYQSVVDRCKRAAIVVGLCGEKFVLEALVINVAIAHDTSLAVSQTRKELYR